MNPRTRQLGITLALVVVAVVCVRAVRSDLFDTNADINDKHDVYFLPAPEQVRLMSLGYQHALADVLWAHVMVSQGLHTFERRRFENLLLLYDAINELDPTWRTPYLMADALITFQSNQTPYEEIVRAREILERGAKQRPYDALIWLNLGQFVSFVAPSSYLDDRPDVAARWRREGVAYLQRAAELGGNDSNVSWQAIGGANILAKAGNLNEAVRFWERTKAATDDEELKEKIQAKLDIYVKQLDEHERLRHEMNKKREQRFRELMTRDLPFIKIDMALVLGPPPQPARCAGLPDDAHPQPARDPACATSWLDWSRRYDVQPR
jgi:hypothetical protein